MKIFFITIVVVSLGLTLWGSVSAQSSVEVDFFYSPTCPHCAKEKVFLRGLEEKYPGIDIRQYDVINDSANQKLLGDFYKKYGVPKSLQGLVPATFTPARYFIGFDDRVAVEIENCLKECLRRDGENFSLENTSMIDKTLKIPVIGEVKLSNLSLPAMAFALGALDGFNVCSLGALILILSLVLVFNSRKKILLFGSAYIITTAAVYGILIFFWYKLFEAFAPYLKIMNISIGVLGVSGGVYFFRQFLKSRKERLICDSEPGSKISSKFLPKLQELLKNPASLWMAIGAVFAFAFVLTVVEFPCSAVVPVAFAAFLAKAGLSPLFYGLYIATFVLFYLLDELIVFFAAVFTSKIWLSSPKFLRWILLAEAIILFSLGLYYLLSIMV